MGRFAKRAVLSVLALSLSLLPSACGGSSLSPETVRAAHEALQGGAAATGPGGQTTGVDATTGGDPAGRTGGTGSGTGDPAPGTGGNGGSGQPPVGTGTHSATGGHTASCKGFRNQTGVTDKTITIANASDISGPVPGIFASAQQATAAYVAYFNATSSICGRKLHLLTLDTRTDAGADQQAYQQACQQAFAVVGSMSAYDSGGAGTAQKCGIPDIRAMATSDARNACTTCFGAQATDLNAFENAVPDFFVRNYHAASQRAAMIYVNAAASVQNAKTQMAVEKRRGMKFVYSASFDVSEFNYTPYVQQMKDKNVRWVQFVGASSMAVNLARAMQNANFKPDVFLLDPSAYNPEFVKTGGSAVDGSFVFIDFTPFEEAAHNKEMQLYLDWLQQVKPGAQPSYFGLFAWSAARLFVEQAAALGGNLTRANMVKRLRGVKDWTDNGMHAPQPVGAKGTAGCWRFIRLHHGKWVPTGGTRYHCGGVTSVG